MRKAVALLSLGVILVAGTKLVTSPSLHLLRPRPPPLPMSARRRKNSGRSQTTGAKLSSQRTPASSRARSPRI